MKKALSIIVLAIILSISTQAQIRNTDQPQFELEGSITSHTGLIPPPYIAIVDKYYNSKMIETKSAKYSVKLSYDNEYVLAFKKKGYVPQLIRISFKNATSKTKGLSSFLYDVQLAIAEGNNEWRTNMKFKHIIWDPKEQVFSKARWVLNREDKKMIMDMIDLDKEEMNLGVLYNIMGDVLNYDKPANFDYVGFGNISKDMPERKKELMAEQINRQQGYLQDDLVRKNDKAEELQKEIERFDLDYSVQVWSSENQLSSTSTIRSLVSDLMEVKSDDGFYRYYTGNFKDFNEANNYYDSLFHKGARDAFVVAFYQGDKITLPNYISEDEIKIRSSGHKMSEYNKEVSLLEVEHRKLELEKKIKMNKLALVQLKNDDMTFEADSLHNQKGIDSLDLLLLYNKNELTHKQELVDIEQKRIQEILKKEKEIEMATRAFRTDPVSPEERAKRRRREPRIEYVYINNPEYHDSVPDSNHLKITAGIYSVFLDGDAQYRKWVLQNENRQAFNLSFQQFITPIFHAKLSANYGWYAGSKELFDINAPEDYSNDFVSYEAGDLVSTGGYKFEGNFVDVSLGVDIQLGEVYKHFFNDKNFRFKSSIFLGGGITSFEGQGYSLMSGDSILYPNQGMIERTNAFSFPAEISLGMPINDQFQIDYRFRFTYNMSDLVDGIERHNRNDHFYMHGVTLSYKLYRGATKMIDDDL